MTNYFFKVLTLCFVVSGILLMACKDDDVRSESYPKEIDFGAFKMNVPDGWTSFKLQGIDSQVGGVTDGKDSLFYDYGWYSNDLQQLPAADYHKSTKKINGLDAYIVRPKKSGEGIIGVYIKVDQQNKFNLLGVSKNEDTVLGIFDSVKFY
jgi:hypothetical protein